MSRSPSRDRSTARAGRTLVASSGGGGGGAATGPTERASGHGQLTSSSNVIGFPTGTAAGDLLILATGSDFRATAPTGWTRPLDDSVSFFNGSLLWKIATAADVTAGSVTLALAGAANGTYFITAITGGTFDPFAPTRISSHIIKSTTTATLPQAMDTFTTLALSRSYYLASRSAPGQTFTCDTGTLQWRHTSAVAANGYYNSGALYAEDVTSAASRTPNWSATPTVADVDGASYDQWEVRAVTTGSKNLTNYATAVLANSPWGFWQQAETSGTTLADSSGNSRTMTITGTPTLGVSSPFTVAQGIRFPDISVNGDSYTTTAATSTSSSVTMSCWLYVPTGTIADGTPIMAMALGYGNATWDKPLYLNSDGKIYFEAYNGANQIIGSSAAITRDTWHHVVASVGAAGMKLRVDKTTVASNAGVTTSYTGAQILMLHGGGSAHTGRPVMGIAAPAFFTSQLSDGQTDAHYDAA